jgi:hypothetical protein
MSRSTMNRASYDDEVALARALLCTASPSGDEEIAADIDGPGGSV